MAQKVLRSRILENFEPILLNDLYKVSKSTDTSDNNTKTDIMLEVLKRHKKDFVELGPGTNRLAILIDNYVFKIALDKWGIQDNWNEFTVSEELQPYVTKTYESNGLIAVSEYITVISREEFDERKSELKEILEILAESYLLGDVGTVGKNFLNWGYRDDGSLAILDFAYIYRIKGEEMSCSKCQSMIQYDDNYYNLICPNCQRKYTFTDIRRRIPMADEKKENFMAISLAYKLIQPLQVFEVNLEEDSSSSYNKKEVIDMRRPWNEPEEMEEINEEDNFLEALEKVRKGKISPPASETQCILIDETRIPITDDTKSVLLVFESDNGPEPRVYGDFSQIAGESPFYGETEHPDQEREQDLAELNTSGVIDTTITLDTQQCEDGVTEVDINTHLTITDGVYTMEQTVDVDTHSACEAEKTTSQMIDLRTKPQTSDPKVQSMRELLRMDISSTIGLSEEESEVYKNLQNDAEKTSCTCEGSKN